MYAQTVRYLASSLRYKSRTLTRLSTRHSLSWPSCVATQVAPTRFVSESASQQGSTDHFDTTTDITEDSSLQELQANPLRGSTTSLGISELEKQAFQIDDVHGTNITFNIEPDASGDAPLELPKIEDALVESNLEPRPAIQATPNIHPNDISSFGSSDSNLYGMSCDPIPLLPPLPEYPVSQIDDKDLKDYVLPLYSRKWAILYGYKRTITNEAMWYKSALISKTFEFPTFEATMDFITEVARLAQAEDHYPNIAFEKTIVYYQSYTPSAFRNTGGAPSEDLFERQRPGITLRDIRLAILIEDTFSRHFLGSGHALPGKPELRFEVERPQSIAEIEQATQISKEHKKKAQTVNTLDGKSRPAKRRSCRVCGERHDPRFCPQRYTKPPPPGKPCGHCSEEGHWTMNCPKKEKRSDNKIHKTLSARLNLTAEWPPAPCPHCGGVDHYKSDCPDMGNRKKAVPPILSVY